jgi:hypothetical protein
MAPGINDEKGGDMVEDVLLANGGPFLVRK